jgi:hypothetical protein
MVTQRTLVRQKKDCQMGPIKVQTVGASWNNVMMSYIHFVGDFAMRIIFNFGHTHTQTITGEFGVGKSQVVAWGHSSGVWQGRCCRGNSILESSIGIDCTPWYGMILVR